ncbi:MAG: TetR/AcrR family transcriptional regulator [Planctomycetes bacterium]|nr:TetR/AcrR family transcriptional regulator [Planctomycetota bacterium]
MPTEAKEKRPAARGRPRDPSLAARRRHEILDAAAKLFAQRGFAATDLQVVADELSVGKGTLYRYFPSKGRLFLAAVDRGMRRLRECVDAACETVGDPLEQIVAAMGAYLGFFDAHPEFAELLIQERAVFRDRKKPTYFEHREANIGRWRSLFAGLIAEGRIRDVPPEQITNVLSNAGYGTMFTNFFTGRRRPLQAQAREIVDVVLHGILTPAERVRRGASGGRKSR